MWRIQSLPCKNRETALVRQSDPLFVPTSLFMKTPTPSTDDPAQEDPLQRYQERVERLSQQNRVIKICTDAGFLTTVPVGQYFMTKDTEEFSQFTESVACREYTLPERLDQREHPNWARIGSHNQLPARYIWSGNLNWICKQRLFSLVGQNFSRLEQVDHGCKQQQGGRRQRSGNLWNAVRRFCVENECICFCEPIKG